MAPQFCGRCGVEDDAIEQFLTEHGFSTQRIWQYRDYDGTKREIWPPKPWAERHLAMVTQTDEDVFQHYVVMDGKGKVYDPADPAYRDCDLSRYYEVHWVSAIYRGR